MKDDMKALMIQLIYSKFNKTIPIKPYEYRLEDLILDKAEKDYDEIKIHFNFKDFTDQHILFVYKNETWKGYFEDDLYRKNGLSPYTELSEVKIIKISYTDNDLNNIISNYLFTE